MLYSIGEFAKVCNIPSYTLRYWESEQLLLPAKIDEATGYRYYSNQQVYLVQKILAAKMNNFKNQEIRNMLEKTAGLETVINKREELLSQKTEIENSIKRLDFIINNLKLHKWPDYNAAIIKQIPGGRYITHRETFENIYKFLDYYISMYNGIWKGKPPTTHAYDSLSIYYHDGLPGKNIDIECCVEISKSFDMTGCCVKDIQVKELGKIDNAASCLHYGPYELIEDTYLYLADWIRANGYERCGYPRLNYISNENTPDISQLQLLNSQDSQLTVIIEIIVPVNKKQI